MRIVDASQTSLQGGTGFGTSTSIAGRLESAQKTRSVAWGCLACESWAIHRGGRSNQTNTKASSTSCWRESLSFLTSEVCHSSCALGSVLAPWTVSCTSWCHPATGPSSHHTWLCPSTSHLAPYVMQSVLGSGSFLLALSSIVLHWHTPITIYHG